MANSSCDWARSNAPWAWASCASATVLSMRTRRSPFLTLSPTATFTSSTLPATWATTGTMASAMISPLYIRLAVSSRRVPPLPAEGAVLLVRVSDGVLTMTGEGAGMGVAAAAGRSAELPD